MPPLLIQWSLIIVSIVLFQNLSDFFITKKIKDAATKLMFTKLRYLIIVISAWLVTKENEPKETAGFGPTVILLLMILVIIDLVKIRKQKKKRMSP
jgi:hypothetical protein